MHTDQILLISGFSDSYYFVFFFFVVVITLISSSHTECLYKLVGFGIPIEGIPLTGTGSSATRLKIKTLP